MVLQEVYACLTQLVVMLAVYLLQHFGFAAVACAATAVDATIPLSCRLSSRFCYSSPSFQYPCYYLFSLLKPGPQLALREPKVARSRVQAFRFHSIKA